MKLYLIPDRVITPIKNFFLLFPYSNGSATTAEATSKTRLNIDLAKRPLPARPPQPPPRVKKQDTNRVGPKSNNSTKTGGPQRPNVPPPAAPTSTSGHSKSKYLI